MEYHVVGGGLNVREELPGMAIQYRHEQPEDFRTWLKLYPRNVGSKFGWGSSAFLEFVEVLIQHELWKELEFESMYAYIEHMIPDAWDHIAEVDQVREQLKPIKAEATKDDQRGGDRRSEDFKVDNVNFDKGNSQQYTLRRLARDHVELFDQVKSGALSANAAAIKAGFRSKTISIPVDKPEAVAKSLRKHMSKKDFDKFVKLITAN
jgi:hypothetical protein